MPPAAPDDTAPPVPGAPTGDPAPEDPSHSDPDARLRPLAPHELSPAQADVYRAITGGRRAGGAVTLTDDEGRLRGPFDAMLRSPEVGGALQALGSALRFSGVLPGRARELVILAVAAAEDSAFERQAHEAVARREGLGDEVLLAVHQGADAPLEDITERTALAVARALLSAGALDDDVYDEAVAILGEQGTFELTTLVGYYRALALQLRVFGAGVAGRTQGSGREGSAGNGPAGG